MADEKGEIEVLIKPSSLLAEYAVSLKKRYYHGTDGVGGAAILSSGKIRPGNTEKKRGRKMTPMFERTYLTVDIEYATIYAVGGNMLGDASWPTEEWKKKHGNICYVFVVNGLDAGDVMIDEDAVGQLVHYCAKEAYYGKDWEPSEYAEEWMNEFFAKTSSALRNNLASWARGSLTTRQWEKLVRYDDIADLIVAGKKLTRSMSDQLTETMLSVGCPFSVNGEVKFDEAWEMEVSRNGSLKKDASNFFELARRVK